MEILREKHQAKVNKEYPLIHFDIIALVWLVFLYFIVIGGVQSSTIAVMAIISTLYLVVALNPNSRFIIGLNNVIFQWNLKTLPWATKNSKYIKWGCLILLLGSILMLGLFLDIFDATILSMIYILTPFVILLSYSKVK